MGDVDFPEITAKDAVVIEAGKLSITRSWLGTDVTRRLLNDARGLHNAGHFTDGRLGGREGKRVNNQTRVCDTCGLFDDAANAPPGTGDEEAREILFDGMAALRDDLMHVLKRPLAESMELQYLRYPGGKEAKGGFYGRHIDHGFKDHELPLQRAVSLLLYLTDGSWDARRDGGVLRAYPRGGAAVDVEPQDGTLVLFDSTVLEHEVNIRFAFEGCVGGGPIS